MTISQCQRGTHASVCVCVLSVRSPPLYFFSLAEGRPLRRNSLRGISAVGISFSALNFGRRMWSSFILIVPGEYFLRDFLPVAIKESGGKEKNKARSNGTRGFLFVISSPKTLATVAHRQGAACSATISRVCKSIPRNNLFATFANLFGGGESCPPPLVRACVVPLSSSRMNYLPTNFLPPVEADRGGNAIRGMHSRCMVIRSEDP